MSMQNNSLQVGNEFTTVQVRKITTRNGEVLEIESKKGHSKITLDAMQLEALTYLKPEQFSKFFEIHFGMDLD